MFGRLFHILSLAQYISNFICPPLLSHSWWGAEGHAYTSTGPQALYLRTEMVSDKHVPESHFCSGVAGG